MEINTLSEEEKMIFMNERTLKHEIEILQPFAFLESQGRIECNDPKNLDKFQKQLQFARNKYNDHIKKHKEYFVWFCMIRIDIDTLFRYNKTII